MNIFRPPGLSERILNFYVNYFLICREMPIFPSDNHKDELNCCKFQFNKEKYRLNSSSELNVTRFIFLNTG